MPDLQDIAQALFTQRPHITAIGNKAVSLRMQFHK